MDAERLNITFRKAKENDLDRVFEVFGSAIAEMDRNNIPQWDERYPDREILSEDIAKQDLIIGISGNEIAVAYAVSSEYEEEYNTGAWQYPNATFRVIHRLCVNPKFQNKGVGAFTLEYIETELKESGIETIRLDAFTLNPYALRMYEKRDYKTIGYVDFRKGKFCLMEKKL